MEDRKSAAALHLARDLCLKMIEHRALGPELLPETLAQLRLTALDLFAEIADDGGPLILRLARDFTVKGLERGQVRSPRDVAAHLTETARWLFQVARKLPPETAAQRLNVAKDLVLKMLEVGRLGFSAAPEMFETLATKVC